MSESQVPAAIITKHDFLVRLDEHCRDPKALDELRELFSDAPDEDRTLQYFVDKQMMAPAVKDLVKGAWLTRRGAFPKIREKTEAAFRDALALASPSRRLTTWLMIGTSDDFDVLCIPRDRSVLLLILAPLIPNPVVVGKEPKPLKGLVDPGFLEHLYAARDKLVRFIDAAKGEDD